MSRRSRQRGMSLVVAIFIIVIIGLLAAFAVTAGTANRESTNLNLQANRARAAARAGAEWGAYRALVANSCPGPGSPTNVALNQAALRGFRVAVTCMASSQHTDGGVYRVVDIVSFAQWSNFGANDYASARVVRRYAP